MILFLVLMISKKGISQVSIVVPVYNEEEDLPKNIPILYKFLDKNLKNYDWQIIIGDNGPSKDRTGEIGEGLQKKFERVRYVLVPRPGRGGALKEIWLNSDADLLIYMDVDLSSDLNFLPNLLEALENGADIAIGSRLAKGGKVYGRTFTREVMSRGYNLMIKFMFWTSFHDAQCGFKGIKRDVAKRLLPIIKDTAWFFDSELLIVGEKAGFKVKEVPITWRDDPRSTVKVAKTAWGDIKGLARLFFSRPWRQLKK